MLKRKIQVFVSSTFTDLIEERQAAVAAILKAGHIPAGMELFTAGDKSQLETIKRWIDESDVYMLILGGRYGSLEPTSGISYTELEYDYAYQQNKPLFAVVININALENKVKSFGTSMLERDNPQALKLFREKVLNSVSSFYNDEKDIRLCVHESLADMRDNPLIKGWVSASDIEDTKALHEEIARLREEKDKLEKSLAVANKIPRSGSGSISTTEIDDIIQVLKNTMVNIPESLSSDGNESIDLLNLFIGNKESLINGATNSNFSSEAEVFLYTNVFPKLIVHGLAQNEKVAGVRYRRSFVNTRGISILSEIEKRLAKKRLKINNNVRAVDSIYKY